MVAPTFDGAYTVYTMNASGNIPSAMRIYVRYFCTPDRQTLHSQNH